MRKLFRLVYNVFVTSVTERWEEPLVLRFDPPMIAGAWCKRP